MTQDEDAAFHSGFDQVLNPRRDEIRAECQRRGLHWARSCVGTRSDGEVAQYMAEWIDEVEERDAQARAQQEFKLTERGVIAAENSAGSGGGVRQKRWRFNASSVCVCSFRVFRPHRVDRGIPQKLGKRSCSKSSSRH